MRRIVETAARAGSGEASGGDIAGAKKKRGNPPKPGRSFLDGPGFEGNCDAPNCPTGSAGGAGGSLRREYFGSKEGWRFIHA